MRNTPLTDPIDDFPLEDFNITKTNLSVFRMKELSYLYWDCNVISTQLKARVKTYCQHKSIDLDYLKTRTRRWKEEKLRMKVVETKDHLLVEQLPHTQMTDQRLILFITTMVAVILGFSINELVRIDQWTIDKLGVGCSTVFCPALLIGMIYEYVETRKLHRLSPSVQLTRNGRLLYRTLEQIATYDVSSVCFLWEDDGEDSSKRLDVLLQNKQCLRLDENGNDQELFLLGDQIASYTNTPFYIIRGNRLRTPTLRL